MRYHLTPVRMAIIKKIRNNCWWGVEKKELLCTGGNVNWCSHYGNSMEVPQKTVELPYDPATRLLGIYLKNTKTLLWKDIGTLLFTVALFTIAKIWKCPQMDEWRCDIYNRLLLSCKKIEILPFVTWMDLEGIMLSEISQTEKAKYCVTSLICGI